MFIAHIGYPKTATTFLQKEVFPNLNEIEYVEPIDTKKILFELINEDPLHHDYEKMQGRLFTENTPTLISLEQLTGSLYSNAGNNKSAIAHGLKEIGVEKVIITIRNQRDAINSAYKQYIQEGGVLPFNKYIQPKTLINKATVPYSPNYFDYWSLVELYVEVFGKENVLVIPFEQIKKDFEKELAKLSRFIDSEIELESIQMNQQNQSLSRFSLRSIRLMNFLTYNRFSPAGVLGKYLTTYKVKVFMRTYIDRLLPKKSHDFFSANPDLIHHLDQYQEGNKKLEEAMGLDLTKLGYLTTKS